ncbi:50S ribosomal protein L19 (plastid) [Lotharella oceanica]|uniref:50S ribosomal protein L19, chloroplastic n=1 Tax=Lotharella oceanica TaxID=641309 RepID=A0A059SNV8_9EUKA|nr:50S ribosomal protein L19 [Lotharella oceanica]
MGIANKVLLNFKKKQELNKDVPHVGDLIQVKVLIKEGNKERLQQYEGTVIAIKKGELITVRRVFQGIGIEYNFSLFAPHIASLIIKRHSKVRRSKLYYLRDRIGKKAQLKNKFILLKT